MNPSPASAQPAKAPWACPCFCCGPAVITEGCLCLCTTAAAQLQRQWTHGARACIVCFSKCARGRALPCGFCGSTAGMEPGACYTSTYWYDSTSKKFTTRCQYQARFRYAAALESKSNVPCACPADKCGISVWSNVKEHFRRSHPDLLATFALEQFHVDIEHNQGRVQPQIRAQRTVQPPRISRPQDRATAAVQVDAPQSVTASQTTSETPTTSEETAPRTFGMQLRSQDPLAPERPRFEPSHTACQRSRRST